MGYVHAFRKADFQFMDSSTFEMWADSDWLPVKARNYAWSAGFGSDNPEVMEYLTEDIRNFLGGDFTVKENVAVATDTQNGVWPFIIRPKLVFIVKEYNRATGEYEEKPWNFPS